MTMRNLDARLNPYAPAALSVFRVVIGLLFAINGTQKLFSWPIPFAKPVSVGDWPYWWAGLIETIAGLLIALGLFTRIAALVAAGHMAVAFFWQHLPSGFWPIANGGERAVFYCFAFLLLVFTGPGAYAVDTMRRRRPVGGRTAPRKRARLMRR